MKHPLFPYGHRRHADPVPGAPALSVRSVSAWHPGTEEPALSEVSLRVPAGARVALVGPNGAGKSTLLKLVAGLLQEESGEVRVFGNPVGACHHRVAYLPQRGEVDWRFPINLRKLVMTGRYVHLGWLRRPGARDRAAVDHAIERLGLRPLERRQIGQLSGGQQQRALLARALVGEADLLLLDEPLNAVDAETRAIISEVLSGLQRTGKTIMVATHDLDSLASEFDGALYLRDGREAEPEPGAFVGLRVGREAAWAH
ncbi:MAG: ABC transporter ATP-binding protein [Rubrobacter sp.]|nr:ABC transporter ATP-binding protein [Rubrobacter sp.]